MQSSKSKDSIVSSLYSTVKKNKPLNQLQHAKSYDDIFAVQQLEPSQVKILLNNDRSLKSIKKMNQSYKLINYSLSQQKHIPHTTRQSKQAISQLLQQSVKKQNLLIKKQLFDPFKYFGSTSQLSSIQQSARHHQSRLQAMFSQSNSPLATDHSASYRKKSPFNVKKKINIDVNRISNSVLIAKLQKLNEHEKKLKQNENNKFISNDKKFSIKIENNKQNKQNRMNNSLHDEYFKDHSYNKLQKGFKNQNKTQNHYYNKNITKKSTQNQQESSVISTHKMSIQGQTSKYGNRKVNCSPKSYVKQAKDKYLKMNLNSLQKVRLKLKLTSSKN